MNKQDILTFVSQQAIDYIELWFTDIIGAVKSVVVPSAKLESIIENGIHFDGSAVEGFSRVAESDMILLPDIETFTLLPWHQNASGQQSARLICRIYTPTHQPFIGDPRNTLIRAMDEAHAMGFVYKTGIELEFFLFNTDDQQRPILDTSADCAGYFDHNSANSHIHYQMLSVLQQLGIQVDSTYSETGAGQHEIDFEYQSALMTADDILTSRLALKATAQQQGMYCTFMPRPIATQPGSGMHIHQTLHHIGSDENAFLDLQHQYQLSQTARYFLAGQLHHARAMSAIVAPLVNSYKRLGTSFEAPVYVTWAHLNRAALVRIPVTSPGREHQTRLELRCPDPSANPYLAQALMLMAGLDGIKNKLELPEPVEETLTTRNRKRLRQVQTLPHSLEEALTVMQSDAVMMNALGPYISERYIAAKKQEVDAYNQQVTSWERSHYLNRY